MTLSIIVATFNAASTLRRALDSILNQTYQDWECIIVDGASADNTLEIVLEYVQKDSRFRYISEPDHGVYDAFNKGWRMVRGEWIYYLGADDELFPNAMAQLLSKDNDVAAIYGDMWFINARGIIKKRSPLGLSQGKFEMISHQAIVVRRCVIEEMGGFDEQYKISADMDLLLRMFAKGYKFVRVDTYVAKFADGGASTTNFNRIWECHHIRKNFSVFSKKKLFYLLCLDFFISYARFCAHKLYRLFGLNKISKDEGLNDK